MKRISITLFAALYLLLHANAALANGPGAETDAFYITQMITGWGETADVKIRFPEDHVMPDPTCLSPDRMYYLTASRTGFKEKLALLLGAFLNHKQVKVYLFDTCGNGGYTREIYQVKVLY